MITISSQIDMGFSLLGKSGSVSLDLGPSAGDAEGDEATARDAAEDVFSRLAGADEHDD
jgi:hypothetical protein